MDEDIKYRCGTGMSACAASTWHDSYHDESTVREYFSTVRNGKVLLCQYQVDNAKRLGWISDNGGALTPTSNEPKSAKKCDDNLPAVNDWVCPTCNNNRVSKCESKCWWCGNDLHP